MASPLEADLGLQVQSPAAQRALTLYPREDGDRRLIEQRPQPRVAAPRDVTVVVHLAGLVAPRRETDPDAARARVPEVLRFLDRRNKRRSDDGADAGRCHQPAAGRAR